MTQTDTPIAEMAERLTALPGSILEDGSVVDYRRTIQTVGPCFIPFAVVPKRGNLLGKAGWQKTPAKDWPSVLPAQDLICIHRVSPSLAPDGRF